MIGPQDVLTVTRLRPRRSVRQVQRRGGRHAHLPAHRPREGRGPDAAGARGRRSRSSSPTATCGTRRWRSRIDEYKSQRIFVMGEVRGARRLPADRRHDDHRGARARPAASTQTAAEEMLIVRPHAGAKAAGPGDAEPTANPTVLKVNVRELQAGRAVAERAAARRRHARRPKVAGGLRVRPGPVRRAPTRSIAARRCSRRCRWRAA